MIHNFIKNTQLVRFSVGNYRSFKEDVVIDLEPLNLVFGGNSSGKSRLLRFLPYLMKCLKDGDFTHKNSIEDILAQTFGKQFGDNIRFSYDLKIQFHNSHIDKHVFDCLYRVEVELVLRNDHNPLNPKPVDSKSNWLLLDKSLRISCLIGENHWMNVYSGKSTLEPEFDTIFESDYENVYYTNIFRIGYNHPLLWKFLYHQLENEDKIHRIIGPDNNLLQAYKYMIDYEYEPIIQDITILDLFYSDDFKYSVYPLLSSSIAYQFRRVFKFDPITKKINLEFNFNNDKNIHPGSGKYYRKAKQLERSQVVFSALHSTLAFLTRDFISHVNIDYTGGLRKITTNAGSLSDLVDLPKHRPRPNQSDGRVPDPHDPETYHTFDHFLDDLNEYLGPSQLNTGYAIQCDNLISDSIFNNITSTLIEKGISPIDLEIFLKTNGYLKRFNLIDLSTRTKVDLNEVGLGISQVLPIVGRLAIAENALLILEQPELHLHPGMQTALAKAIVHSSLTRNNRFLIETHSEHLIKAIQLEVARYTATNGREGIAVGDVNVLYARKDPKKKSSSVRKIQLDSFGNFTEPWPDDFFDSGADLTLERLRMMNRN